MKISYSVNNLRRLTSAKHLEIRPITVLLGRNSVGKSTYLRSFPLLKQSISTKSSAPILWYGDYVDFGNFQSAVAHGDVKNTIHFQFELEDYTAKYGEGQLFYDHDLGIRNRQQNHFIPKVQISYGVACRDGKTERKDLSVCVPSHGSNLQIDFGVFGSFVRSVRLNDMDIKELWNDLEIYLPVDHLFVEPIYFRRSKEKNRKLQAIEVTSHFRKLVKNELDLLTGRRISNNKKYLEAAKILRHPTLSNNALTDLARTNLLTFRRIYEKFSEGEDPQLLKRINTLCQSFHMLKLLESVGNTLSSFFEAVSYIGPARARSERFYRQQELEVSEISSDGKNLPMFLASLDSTDLQNFSDWVQQSFGYGISVLETEGHISINLLQGGQFVNVVDTGYGVSQILPVLAQVWWQNRNQNQTLTDLYQQDNPIRTFAIEQPELHLHPAHQAKLADVFCEGLSIENSGKPEHNQRYIVETHSEALVNRLGELIEAGSLSPNDVHVLVFGDSSDEKNSSTLTVSEFNEEGVLTNWPYGFFNYF